MSLYGARTHSPGCPAKNVTLQNKVAPPLLFCAQGQEITATNQLQASRAAIIYSCSPHINPRRAIALVAAAKSLICSSTVQTHRYALELDSDPLPNLP
ncbi:hypothetical protein Acr_11g0009980 [Actinidia rufa]|uniref:Uncharacterized protein n=1 Tax=Actinidia rufa TaxID=165716 RepID=A0A7J0FDB9_9ERIC|nr:hypothetical protein Acr_11g0009980 [Actinidia rufa]